MLNIFTATKLNVLVTGFEPFGNSKVNSSWETAVRVRQLAPIDMKLEILQLPVDFVHAGEMMREVLNSKTIDLLVMLGQRGKGQSIDIERIAVNLMDSSMSDNAGFCPTDQIILPTGESAYFSNLQVKVLRDAVLKKGISARVSNSAGLYVCNSTYYNVLDEIYKYSLPVKVVFVHLPKISDEFTVDILADSVMTIIENSINKK